MSKIKSKSFFIVYLFALILYFVAYNSVLALSPEGVSPEGISKITTELSTSIRSPIGNASVQVVTAVGAFLNFSIITLALITGNITLVFNIGLRIWLSILYALGIRRRNKPWGTIYDSNTKEPVSFCSVLLKNLEGKVVAHAVTDKEGRYGFLADPGVYAMIVNRHNYVFPSHHVLDKNLDSTYPDTYWGDYFEIKEKGAVINRNIPVDKKISNINIQTNNNQDKIFIFKKRDVFFQRLADVFFLTGFTISAVALLNNITKYNLLIFSLYSILFFTRFIRINRNKKGKVIYKSDQLPVAFGILHVLDYNTKRNVSYTGLDSQGNYFCILPNGKYFITIEKKNFDGTYSKILNEATVEVNGGLLKKTFRV
ncbi:MAG: carboxypeptidase-like regulatory domain-containing protein [bacterium]|nr:carboxypeptidase-like regulatory domain-containing protein [bacterium]